MIHQSFNKDQNQSLPDASVEHQHVLVRVVPPVASPEGCSVLATNVTTWPSVLKIGCTMANPFPGEKKGFSQKSRKVAFWVDDNVQRFHTISSSLYYTFQIPEKSSEKKNNISYV